MDTWLHINLCSPGMVFSSVRASWGQWTRQWAGMDASSIHQSNGLVARQGKGQEMKSQLILGPLHAILVIALLITPMSLPRLPSGPPVNAAAQQEQPRVGPQPKGGATHSQLGTASWSPGLCRDPEATVHHSVQTNSSKERLPAPTFYKWGN